MQQYCLVAAKRSCGRRARAASAVATCRSWGCCRPRMITGGAGRARVSPRARSRPIPHLYDDVNGLAPGWSRERPENVGLQRSSQETESPQASVIKRVEDDVSSGTCPCQRSSLPEAGRGDVRITRAERVMTKIELHRDGSRWIFHAPAGQRRATWRGQPCDVCPGRGQNRPTRAQNRHRWGPEPPYLVSWGAPGPKMWC